MPLQKQRKLTNMAEETITQINSTFLLSSTLMETEATPQIDILLIKDLLYFQAFD